MTNAAHMQRVVFVFPMASGHVNPALPIARSLVKQGHEVHFVCYEQMRPAIEATGATYHSEKELEPEFFNGRGDDVMTSLTTMQEEYGLKHEPFLISMMLLRYTIYEQQLPGLLRFLRKLKPQSVVYCPISSAQAAWSCQVLGIPSVALLTTAGPGSLYHLLKQFCDQIRLTPEELDCKLKGFQPHLQACQRLKDTYNIVIPGPGMPKPLGIWPHLTRSAFTLVTTSEDLYDPMTAEIESYYRSIHATFIAVGPLIDEAGSKRAAGHKANGQLDEAAHTSTQVPGLNATDILQAVKDARKIGRRVVMVSMGTVITGDFPTLGWEGRNIDKDGKPFGLTGRELCRAAWGAVFDTFGSTAKEEGPLIVVSMGPQPNALGELNVPPNALCAPVLPQVDLLSAGVDLFLTHGGQNSFTESLGFGVPVVVCPGFGDQAVNADKAVSLRVGLKVDRPQPTAGGELEAASAYRAATSEALLAVWGDDSYKVAAERCAQNLKLCGGVPRAVELILSAGLNRRDVACAGA